MHEQEKPIQFFDRVKKTVARGITPFLISGAIETGVLLHAKKVQGEAADDRAVAAEFNRENDNPNELRQIEAETPEEAQQKINKILTLVDQGKIAPEALNKIDQGMLIITQMKMDGQITPEEAKELQQLLTAKRDKYKKMAETDDTLSILHEIVQEHTEHDPNITDLASFLKTGHSNCRGAAAGFAAIIQGVFPNLKLSLQNFSGPQERDGRLREGHTRLILEVNGQWFALEKPTVTPIQLAEGSTVTPLTDITKVMADKKIQPNIVAGEALPIPTVDQNIAKKNKERTSKKDDIIARLGEAQTVQPTAIYSNNPPSKTPTPLKIVSKTEAQARFTPEQKAQLASAQTRLQFEKDTREGKLEIVTTDYDPDDSIIFDFEKSPVKKEADKLITGFHELAELQSNQAEDSKNSEKISQKLNELAKFVNDIASQDKQKLENILEQLKKDPAGIALTINNQEFLKIMTIAAADLRKKIPTTTEKPHLSSEDQKKYAEISITHNREFNLKPTLFDLHYRYGAYEAELSISEQTIKQIAAELKQKQIELKTTTFDISPADVRSLKESWFTDLRFEPTGRTVGGNDVYEFDQFSFQSHDTDLSFLKRDDITSIEALNINAPVADFSIIASLHVRNLTLKNISPLADLSTITYNPEQAKEGASDKLYLDILNIPPQVDLSKLDTEQVYASFTFADLPNLTKHKKQLDLMNDVIIESGHTTTDLAALSGNNSIERLELNNMDPSEADKAIIQSMLALEELSISPRKNTKINEIQDEWVKFSKIMPNLTIFIKPEHNPNTPDLRLLKIKNGLIEN